MSIIAVDILSESGLSESTDDKGRSIFTAKRKLRAVADSLLDNETSVRFDYRVPRVKDVHPQTWTLRVNSVDVNRESQLTFLVDLSYSSPPIRDETTSTSPLSQATEFEYFSTDEEGEIAHDYDGNPIVNVNSERITGVTRPFGDLGIRMVKNFATFDPAVFYTYRKHTNSDTYLGFDPGTLLIDDINAKVAWHEEFPYWVVTTTILARYPYNTTAAKAWYKRVLHEGFKERATASDKPQRAMDPVLKVFATSPVPLAEDGTRVPDGDPLEYLEWKIYGSIAFSTLGY